MKQTIIKKPTRLDDINFDDLYEELSRDWQVKSQRMQNRRWNSITDNGRTDESTAKHVVGTKFWLIRI